MYPRLGALALLAAGLASGQTAGQTAQTTFEVATIKPSVAPTAATVAAGQFHIGTTIDAGRADFGFVSLKDLIGTAYKVKDYQIAGPDWLATQRFNVVAKIPDGVGADKIPEMMQALLADRFGLKAHTESREHPVYILVQAKGGAKLKESAAPTPAPPPDPNPDPNKAKAQTSFSIGTGSGAMTITAGRGGASIRTADGGVIRMGMSPDGAMQMQAAHINMTALSEFLNRLVDRPVLDRTDLKGYHEVNLDVALADLIKAAASSGVIAPGMAEAAGRGGALPPGAAAAMATAGDPSGGSVFQSIQKLGLRLEPSKEQLPTIVIDHVDKNPSEN